MENISYYIRILTPILFIFCFCISRNNPWDPANGCPPQYKSEILAKQALEINQSLSAISNLNRFMLSNKTLYDSLKALDSIINNRNAKVKFSNGIISAHNDSIEKSNILLSDCTPLGPKSSLDTMSFFSIYVETDIGNYKKQVEAESLRIATVIATGNQSCLPQGIYSSFMVDSIFVPVKSSLVKWDSLVNRAFEFRTTTDTLYPKVIAFNKNVQQENLLIKSYNDSISRLVPFCGGSHISDSEQIRTIAPHLKPRDTLRIDPGSYNVQVSLRSLGNDTAAIVIMGSPGMNTTFSPSNFFISGSTNIRIYNINFTNGAQTSGLRIEDNSRNIHLENCTFSNNDYDGLDLFQSSAELKNVRVFNNLKSGISIQDTEYILNADNLLVVNNGEYGINSLTSSLIIKNATISDNKLDGIYLDVANNASIIQKSLITFNGGFGIFRKNNAIGSGYFFSPGTDFFGNTSGAMSADSTYLNYNLPYIQLDPMYQNKSANDYHIGNASQCDRTSGYQY